MKAEEVKQFWSNRALDKENYSTVSVTYDDIHRRELENHYINLLLPHHGTSLLDVGCGSGYGTKDFSKRFEDVLGIDFSPEMIQRAKEENSSHNITYHVADMVTDAFPEQFDYAISQRVIQNIPSVEDQKQAILNIHKSLKPGGYYIFCECINDNREHISVERSKLGLEPLPELNFNFEFDYVDTLNFLSEHFYILEDINLGLYDFISKIIYPAAIHPNQPKFDSNINKYVSEFLKNHEEFVDNNNNPPFWQYNKTFLLKLRKK